MKINQILNLPLSNKSKYGETIKGYLIPRLTRISNRDEIKRIWFECPKNSPYKSYESILQQHGRTDMNKQTLHEIDSQIQELQRQKKLLQRDTEFIKNNAIFDSIDHVEPFIYHGKLECYLWLDALKENSIPTCVTIEDGAFTFFIDDGDYIFNSDDVRTGVLAVCRIEKADKTLITLDDLNQLGALGSAFLDCLSEARMTLLYEISLIENFTNQ